VDIGEADTGAEAGVAGLGAALLSEALAALSPDGAGESPDLTSTAGALFLPPPSRKSVTYQPVPLSWKPAAVSCFLKVA
jgi:hypothetical protein